MSDTPRTDAEVFEVDVVFVSYDGPAFESKNVVEPDFARELERENAALREDKERLDWLDESGAEVYKCGNSEDGSVLFFVDTDPSTVFSADTLRAAIDAARAKEGQL